MIARFAAPLFLALLAAPSAQAQEPDRAPPADARPLSEIVAAVEKRDGFRYIDEVEWDEDGFWNVTYYTSDRAKVEIRYDPVSGDPG